MQDRPSDSSERRVPRTIDRSRGTGPAVPGDAVCLFFRNRCRELENIVAHDGEHLSARCNVLTVLDKTLLDGT